MLDWIVVLIFCCQLLQHNASLFSQVEVNFDEIHLLYDDRMTRRLGDQKYGFIETKQQVSQKVKPLSHMKMNRPQAPPLAGSIVCIFLVCSYVLLPRLGSIVPAVF
jgi:hypothetical protein